MELPPRPRPGINSDMSRFFIVPLLLLAARVWAGDNLPILKTVNAAGTLIELRDVKIVKVEADGVRVMHSSGTAKVPFERLPDDLQAKYGIDPSKAYQYREAAQAGTGAVATAPALASGSEPATAPQRPGVSSPRRTSRPSGWPSASSALSARPIPSTPRRSRPSRNVWHRSVPARSTPPPSSMPRRKTPALRVRQESSAA